METGDQWRSRNVYLVASARALIGPLAALPRCDVKKSAAGAVAKYRFRVRALRVGETDGHRTSCWASLTPTFQVVTTAATLSRHKL